MVDRLESCHLLGVEDGSNRTPYWIRHQKAVLSTVEQPSNCRLTPTHSQVPQYRFERKGQRRKKALTQNNAVYDDYSPAVEGHGLGNVRGRTPQRGSHSTMGALLSDPYQGTE